MKRRNDGNQRWPYPEQNTNRGAQDEGSQVREADAEDLQRLGLRPGHRVFVSYR